MQFKISIVLIEIALVIQIFIVRYKRSEILKAQIAAGIIDEETANQSYFSIAGLTTLFNALT